MIKSTHKNKTKDSYINFCLHQTTMNTLSTNFIANNNRRSRILLRWHWLRISELVGLPNNPPARRLQSNPQHVFSVRTVNPPPPPESYTICEVCPENTNVRHTSQYKLKLLILEGTAIVVKTLRQQ